MGVGTNILGYNNLLVDSAVKTINNGNLSIKFFRGSFLAEKLISMHPWAQMVHFARSGGGNAIAVRIARAATNKHKVMFVESWLA